MFFVSLDAMHYATACKNSMNYEILLQSVKWVLIAHYAKLAERQHDVMSMYQRALRLAADCDLPEYKNWIIEEIKTLQMDEPVN